MDDRKASRRAASYGTSALQPLQSLLSSPMLSPFDGFSIGSSVAGVEAAVGYAGAGWAWSRPTRFRWRA